ncbi:MAG: hypothetical protein KDG50_04985 [Chromatiales bacterium]|nr:hypothetical protein [Chromatiales bacterium]
MAGFDGALLSAAQFDALVGSGPVISEDRFGPKVIRLADGRWLKLFRRKRRFSSAAWNPYALRFARSAIALERLGIPSVQVESVFRCRARERDGVIYRDLPGDTVRDLLAGSRSATEVLAQTGRFIADLHARGVQFRSVHLGNIVRGPGHRFGLIDIADVRVRRRPLSTRERIRNLAIPLRHRDDRRRIEALGVGHLVDAYLDAIGAKPRLRARYRAELLGTR